MSADNEPAKKRRRDGTAAANAAPAAANAARATTTSIPRAQFGLTPAEDMYHLGRQIERRSGMKMGTFATEDRKFREFFGGSVFVALAAWRLLKNNDLLPEESGMQAPQYLLWAMFFMKNYPKEGPACGAAGGSTNSKNAVDPKTWRNYVWPYIYALSDLEGPVVSLFMFCICIKLQTHTLLFTD